MNVDLTRKQVVPLQTFSMLDHVSLFERGKARDKWTERGRCKREGERGGRGRKEGCKKDTEGVECKAHDKLWLINVVRDGSVERCLLMERIRVAVQLNLHTVTLHQAPWSESNETAQQKHTHTHHTHTHTCWFLWFTGTFHRCNGFYTVQTVCAIALHLHYT